MSNVEREHHEKLVSGLYEQLKMIFESSEQPMYLYLDDNHWIANKKFLSLLEYKSMGEIIGTKQSLLDVLVDVKSQETLATAYNNAMTKMVGSTIRVEWKKKSGTRVDSTVIIVPIVYQGHLLALHFLSPKS